ncbi:MAG: DUF3619 family protein [Methylotenera sp.]|nr:DUF3619 family protein [Methylotenera sp.]
MLNNQNNHTQNNLVDSVQLAETQLAQNMIALLEERAQHLTLSEVQRLSTARNLAINKMTATQTATIGIHRNGNALQWFGHHRLASATLVIGLVVISLFSVQQLSMTANLEASDAFLLASDLPPEAYADKGFDTWLDSK